MRTTVVRRPGAYLWAAITFVFLPIGASPSFPYDRKDAGFVTTSKNKAVLDYIVCLEEVVADTPKKMDVEASLDRAEARCKAMAAKLPRLVSEPDAEDIRAMVVECGFRPGEASPDMGCVAPVEKEHTPVVAKRDERPIASGQYSLSQTEQDAIHLGVRERLKDPMSAVFGGAVAKRDPNGFIYVCGSVNAKNSFGGYTGHQPYSGMLVVEGPKVFFAVVGIAGSEDERTAILTVCHDRGLL